MKVGPLTIILLACALYRSQQRHWWVF